MFTFIAVNKCCAQTWPGKFLLQGAADDTETHDCSGVENYDGECSALRGICESPFHPPKAQRTSRKREQRGCESQRMRKSVMKCCLLDITRPLHSRTRGNCGYLHKTRQILILDHGGGVREIPPFTEELLQEMLWARAKQRKTKIYCIHV